MKSVRMMNTLAVCAALALGVVAVSHAEDRDQRDQREQQRVERRATPRPAARPAAPRAQAARPQTERPEAGRPPVARQSAPQMRGGLRLDARYNHGRYYPPVGQRVRVLPPGYRPYYYRGAPYYFSGGAWYAPGPGGVFLVSRPPVGLFLSVLPPFYTTVWFGGVPYYYADDTYYLWQPNLNGYVVAQPPADAADSEAATTAPAAAAPTEDFYIYPKNGQSEQQQAADRYECYTWAKGQTGFDPTQAGGGVAPGQADARRADYRRAMGACLDARGYSIQ